MTIAEIKQRYSLDDVSKYPGDLKLHYEVFSPLFSNLYENKIIYRERFIGIVQLEDIKISPKVFDATAVPQLLLERQSRFDKYFLNRSWKFGAVWDHIRLTSDDGLNSPYANWCIWCDPETVMKAEEFIINKQFDKAMQLIDKTH